MYIYWKLYSSSETSAVINYISEIFGPYIPFQTAKSLTFNSFWKKGNSCSTNTFFFKFHFFNMLDQNLQGNYNFEESLASNGIWLEYVRRRNVHWFEPWVFPKIVVRFFSLVLPRNNSFVKAFWPLIAKSLQSIIGCPKHAFNHPHIHFHICKSRIRQSRTASVEICVSLRFIKLLAIWEDLNVTITTEDWVEWSADRDKDRCEYRQKTKVNHDKFAIFQKWRTASSGQLP